MVHWYKNCSDTLKVTSGGIVLVSMNHYDPKKVSKVCCFLSNFKTTFFYIITTVLEQAGNLSHHFWIYFVSVNFTWTKLGSGGSYLCLGSMFKMDGC